MEQFPKIRAAVESRVRWLVLLAICNRRQPKIIDWIAITVGVGALCLSFYLVSAKAQCKTSSAGNPTTSATYSRGATRHLNQAKTLQFYTTKETMKPLENYTSYTPVEEYMQEKYGAQLQGVKYREKLYLIVGIAAHLCCLESEEMREEIFQLAGRIHAELTESDQLSLIESLVNQCKYQ